MTDDQFLALLTILIEIRDALQPPDEAPVEGCPHVRKVNVSTPGDPGHYLCPDCQSNVYDAGRISGHT